MFVFLLGSVASGDGATASDLQAMVRQQAVVVSQDAGIGDGSPGLETARFKLLRVQHSGDQRIGQHGHEAVFEIGMQALRGISAGGDAYSTGFDGSARRGEGMDAVV